MELKDETRAYSVIDALMYARLTELYLIYLRKRPEVGLTEKSQLTSIIAKLKRWVEERKEYMLVRYPDMKDKLNNVLDLDGDSLSDLSVLCNFVVKNCGDTDWVNRFIPKSAAYKSLEKYHQLRLQGMTDEEACTKLV